MSTHYAANSVLRFEALNTTIHSVNVNPAISYKLYEKISLGIGLQAQYLKTNISNFNGMYTGGAALDAMLAANNPSNLNAHGWGYGNSLGVLFNPNAQTRIGVGFRSSIRTKLQGDGQQYTWPGPVVPAPSNAFLFNAQTSIKTTIKTPATLNTSAAHDLSNWSIKASTGMNFWNVFNNISINTPNAYKINNVITTRWQNSWFAALGADYHPSTVLTLRGGLAFDESTSSNMYQSPRFAESNRFLASVGQKKPQIN